MGKTKRTRKTKSVGTFELLPLARIGSAARQPRTVYAEAALKELAGSIRRHGMLQPVIVRANPARSAGHWYTVIAGERRLRAAKRAGLDKVPALVRWADDKTAFIEALVENVVREDLSPLEEATAFKVILGADSAMSQEKLAALVQRSQSYVSNKLRLLEVEPELQADLVSGKVSEAHLKSLLTLAAEERKSLLEAAKREHWPSRRLEAEVARVRQRVRQKDEVAEQQAKKREAALAVMKRAVGRGQVVYAVAAAKGTAGYFSKGELPKGVRAVESATDVPVERQLRFAQCQRCPAVAKEVGGVKISRGILVGYGFEVQAACGNVEHFAALGKAEREGVAAERRDAVNAVERGRKVIEKVLRNGALRPLGLRAVLYTAYTVGSTYGLLGPSAQALVRRAGLQVRDDRPWAALWEATQKLSDEEVAEELAAFVSREVVRGGDDWVGTRHKEAREALFAAALRSLGDKAA